MHYPKWHELREEDLEYAPKVMLSIYDAQNNLVRRIEGANGKGFQRVAWDLKISGV